MFLSGEGGGWEEVEHFEDFRVQGLGLGFQGLGFRAFPGFLVSGASSFVLGV